MIPQSCIVVYGNAVDGLSFYGPFPEDDYDKVCESLSMVSEDTWTIAVLSPISEVVE